MIYDADSVVDTGYFINGLQPGSMLFKDLIKNTPYDIAKIRVRTEGVFRVLESREKLSKKVTAISVEKVTPEQNKRSYPQNSQAGTRGKRMTEEVTITSLGKTLKLKSLTLN